jgi:hypothetical protein
MIEYQELLDTLFGIGQLFSLLLLLFGMYLSTLAPVLTAKRSDEDEQERTHDNGEGTRNVRISVQTFRLPEHNRQAGRAA